LKISLGRLRRIIREVVDPWTNGGQVEVTIDDLDERPLVVQAIVQLDRDLRGSTYGVDGYEVLDVQPDGWEGPVDVASFEKHLDGGLRDDFERRLVDAALSQWQPVGGDDDREWDDPNMGGRDPMDEAAPPGWEGTVKAMKKHPEVDNPWALAWHMKKRGAKSHHRKSGDKR
jgi:hypothetical protein